MNEILIENISHFGNIDFFDKCYCFLFSREFLVWDKTYFK